MPKIANTLNVGQLMRKYSDGHPISPDAVCELIDRIQIFVECNMESIILIAEKHGRKTVFADDITEFFNCPGHDIENMENAERKEEV